MRTINLNGKWKVRAEPLSCKGEAGLKRVKNNRAGWLESRVPGEIHRDLIRAGRMPEPLISTNAPKCRWPEKKSWWYRTNFSLSQESLNEERLQLILDGVDHYAQVFLNGTRLGDMKNSYVPGVFDIRDAAKLGKNELVVRVTVGAEFVGAKPKPVPHPADDVYGNRYFPELGEIRKPMFTYGWDWVDALPNIGIWRGVRIEGRSHVVIDDFRLDTVLHGENVYLKMSLVLENLHPWSERKCSFELSITSPSGDGITRSYNVDVPIGRTPVEDWIEIPDAQLWWPNGMGEQPLYHVEGRVMDGKRETDDVEMNMGLRTVEIDRSPLQEEGTRFCVRVNGEDVFCRGGNWIPADAIVARVSKRKYERLIAEARNANITMLRIWGGGVYEDPVFYEACDRAGVLVWQDFMFCCSQYPDTRPDFQQMIRSEAETAVKALRHHPCIALWSGNNECIEGFHAWWNQEKTYGDDTLNIGGSILYNQVLPDVCRLHDPFRPYWPGSPSGGEDPNSQMEGDCHWWHFGTMHPDMNRRIRHEVYDECRARFVSEYGVIGPCQIQSIKQYLDTPDPRPGTRAWQVHTNTFEKETIPAAIRLHYADPESLELEEYLLYGQMFQATMYGRSIEAMRFRKQDPVDDCGGSLIWMYGDCWGETGWTIIDYYLRRKPSYYWLRRACTPMRPIVRQRGNDLVVRVVNDSLREAGRTLVHGWTRIDGTKNRLKRSSLHVEPNSMEEVARERIPSRKSLDPGDWIYTAYFESEDGDPASATWSLAPYRELRLGEPEIAMSVRGNTVELLSPVYCHGVHAEDGGRAMLSDNYVDMLPGVPVKIERVDGRGPQALKFQAVMPKV